MEKLNEVKRALKYLELDAKEHADNFSANMIVSTKTILAIAEAFRALEQQNSKLREERAGFARECNVFEAKMAELDRREPYGWLVGLPGLYPAFTLDYRNVEQAIAAGRYEITPIFTRPAPAINLAEQVPDGFVMVPRALTAENGAKAALSGEFNLEYDLVCHECFGEGCDDCSGEGRWTNSIPVDWTTIKEIWAKGVEHFQAATPEAK